MKRTEGVLLLECLDKSDPGSEGRFLSHMFNIMQVKHQYIEIKTLPQLMALLKCSPYKIIHITTHGSVNKKEKFFGLWTKKGNLTSKQLESLKGKLKGYSIVSTACKSGTNDFRTSFIKTAQCDFFIAPKGSPKFHNSIFFSHIFYHKYFILKKDIKTILSQYNKKYKNPHNFVLISFDDYIDKVIDKSIKNKFTNNKRAKQYIKKP
jgi:hypothetical protein